MFFGEDLPDTFYQCVIQDSPEADLLIVMGTSLQDPSNVVCAYVLSHSSLIPAKIPPHVPRVLINKSASRSLPETLGMSEGGANILGLTTSHCLETVRLSLLP